MGGIVCVLCVVVGGAVRQGVCKKARVAEGVRVCVHAAGWRKG